MSRPTAAAWAPTAPAIRITAFATTADLVGLQHVYFYCEDDTWDVAVKYAADWNSIKVSAAAGYTQLTDEGCKGTFLSSASRPKR